MHFHSIVTLPAPHVERYKDTDIASEIAAIDNVSSHAVNNVSLMLYQHRKALLKSMLNPFVNAVRNEVDCIVGKHVFDNEDEYEFYVPDDELATWERDAIMDFLKFPNGTIIPAYSSYNYRIIDGSVKYVSYGKRPFRGRKAKKVKAIKNAHIQDVYKNLNMYLKAMGYAYNPDTGMYGEYANPNGMLDFYDIGGRWPGTFIVKEDVTDVIDDIFFDPREKEYVSKCPNGFKRVSGARAKDIEWEEMDKVDVEEITERYNQLTNMLETNTPAEYMQIVDGDLVTKRIRADGNPAGIFLKKDTTLEEYIEANRASTPDRKFPKFMTELFTDEGYNPIDLEDLEEVIDSLDPDSVIVSVDYHC